MTNQRFTFVRTTLAELLQKFKNDNSNENHVALEKFLKETMIQFMDDALENDDDFRVEVYDYLLGLFQQENNEMYDKREKGDSTIINESIMDLYTLYGIPSPIRSINIATRQPQSNNLGVEIFDNIKTLLLKHFDDDFPLYFNNALVNGNYRLANYMSGYIEMDKFLNDNKPPMGKYILIINSLECLMKIHKEEQEDIISLLNTTENFLTQLKEDDMIEFEMFLQTSSKKIYETYNRFFLQ